MLAFTTQAPPNRLTFFNQFLLPQINCLHANHSSRTLRATLEGGFAPRFFLELSEETSGVVWRRFKSCVALPTPLSERFRASQA